MQPPDDRSSQSCAAQEAESSDHSRQLTPSTSDDASKHLAYAPQDAASAAQDLQDADDSSCGGPLPCDALFSVSMERVQGLAPKVAEDLLALPTDTKRPRDRARTARAALTKRGGRSTSSFRGVTHHIRTGRWESHIWSGGKQVYLGGFDCEEQAALAYDIAAIKCRGDGATTNFALENFTAELAHLDEVTHDDLIMSLRKQSKGYAKQGSSQFRGVTHHQKGKWEARIGCNSDKKYMYLGLFDTEEAAAVRYDEEAVRQRGLCALTNFGMEKYVHLLPLEVQAEYYAMLAPAITVAMEGGGEGMVMSASTSDLMRGNSMGSHAAVTGTLHLFAKGSVQARATMARTKRTTKASASLAALRAQASAPLPSDVLPNSPPHSSPTATLLYPTATALLQPMLAAGVGEVAGMVGSAPAAARAFAGGAKGMLTAAASSRLRRHGSLPVPAKPSGQPGSFLGGLRANLTGIAATRAPRPSLASRGQARLIAAKIQAASSRIAGYPVQAQGTPNSSARSSYSTFGDNLMLQNSANCGSAAAMANGLFRTPHGSLGGSSQPSHHGSCDGYLRGQVTEKDLNSDSSYATTNACFLIQSRCRGPMSQHHEMLQPQLQQLQPAFELPTHEEQQAHRPGWYDGSPFDGPSTCGLVVADGEEDSTNDDWLCTGLDLGILDYMDVEEMEMQPKHHSTGGAGTTPPQAVYHHPQVHTRLTSCSSLPPNVSAWSMQSSGQNTGSAIEDPISAEPDPKFFRSFLHSLQAEDGTYEDHLPELQMQPILARDRLPRHLAAVMPAQCAAVHVAVNAPKSTAAAKVTSAATTTDSEAAAATAALPQAVWPDVTGTVAWLSTAQRAVPAPGSAAPTATAATSAVAMPAGFCQLLVDDGDDTESGSGSFGSPVVQLLKDSVATPAATVPTADLFDVCGHRLLHSDMMLHTSENDWLCDTMDPFDCMRLHLEQQSEPQLLDLPTVAGMPGSPLFEGSLVFDSGEEGCPFG